MSRYKLGLGLLSGTSVDGIDVALVAVGEQGGLGAVLIAGETFPYAPTLRAEILQVVAGERRSLAELIELDNQIALAFAEAGYRLVRAVEQTPDFVASHGQTVWHQPPKGNQLGYSWQMGRGEVIAQQLGIATVADFRKADVAVGGQGAPLVPMVDWLLLTHPYVDRVVQNIGGISNFTYLPKGAQAEQVMGGDNAPGNVLIDLAMQALYQLPFDPAGTVGRSGKICAELVDLWLADDFLQQPLPKSTGREYYSNAYWQARYRECQEYGLAKADVVASLTEFTARAIANSYQQLLPALPQQVILCGGGSKNLFLRDRLQCHLGDIQILTSDRVGIDADYKEAIAFVVLGYLRLHNRVGNLPQITGAKKAVPLGEVFLP
ncbi:MAG: anhydro-N-acetylmuramic acid kinase [Pseudanabaenaceae cyanobacterium]